MAIKLTPKQLRRIILKEAGRSQKKVAPYTVLNQSNLRSLEDEYPNYAELWIRKVTPKSLRELEKVAGVSQRELEEVLSGPQGVVTSELGHLTIHLGPSQADKFVRNRDDHWVPKLQFDAEYEEMISRMQAVPQKKRKPNSKSPLITDPWKHSWKDIFGDRYPAPFKGQATIYADNDDCHITIDTSKGVKQTLVDVPLWRNVAMRMGIDYDEEWEGPEEHEGGVEMTSKVAQEIMDTYGIKTVVDVEGSGKPISAKKWAKDGGQSDW